jgi:hypothetical protein
VSNSALPLRLITNLKTYPYSPKGITMYTHSPLSLFLTAFLFAACATHSDELSKEEARQLAKTDHITDFCAEFDWYGDDICDDFCLLPDPDCLCGDGTDLICEIEVEPCASNLVREVVGGCFGECVDPTTCLPAPEQCGDGTDLICEIEVEPCASNLVREVVGGCFGECVDPTTCLPATN